MPTDVLLQLGSTEPRAPRPDQRLYRLGDEAAVLEACHGEPATLDQLASRARMLAPSRWSRAVRALERAGWMEHVRGLCWPQ